MDSHAVCVTLQISEAESCADRAKANLVREKAGVEQGKEEHRHQELDLERLSKDISMAKVRQPAYF